MSFPESPHLIQGDGQQIGILTLWTKKEHVLAHVPKDLYAVASQLYSRDEGISNLLRSLLTHKEIRDLVITGSDLNGCADALIALFENGVEHGRVIGAAGYVDPEIPSQAVDRVREHVQLHDHRTTQVRKLAERIKAIPNKPSWGEPEEFPQAQLKPPKHFPFANQHVLRHSDLSLAAQELASRQRRLGTLRNVQVQLTKQPSKNITQVKPPEHELRTTGAFTSTHLGQATLSQAIAVLQESPSEVFTLTVDELTADELTKQLPEYKRSRRISGDPASNIRIQLQGDVIQVTHLAPDGKRLEVFSDASGEELYRRLVEEFRVSDISHAAYLGYELGKAEFALKSGEWYEQDAPLFFSKQQ